MVVSLEVNGVLHVLDVVPTRRLLGVLRDDLALTGAKHGCGEGVCGACAVLPDGAAVNSCSVLAGQVDGCEVVTVAGLAEDGELHPLQRELVERGAVQCGFCTPGMLIAGLEAVRIGAAGSRDEIRSSLAGNLCRCTGYGGIVEAIEAYREAVGA